MLKQLSICTSRQGLHEITDKVADIVASSGVREGVCHIFIQHTSASLIIQENADPSARKDLETWLNRLVPENDPHYTHTLEGPDDMPSHIKSMLTQTTLTIPVVNGELALGTWQGVYVWEHRREVQTRSIIVKIV